MLDLGCAPEALDTTTVDLVGLFAVEDFDFDELSVMMMGAGAAEDEENLELKLDIHDDFVGVFSAELERPSKPGRRVEELRVGPALGVGSAVSFSVSCGLFCSFSWGFTCCGGCAGLSGGVIAGDG